MLINFVRALCAVFFLWLFAAPASAAQGKDDKSGKVGGFNFLPALFVVCIFAILTACGGGGSGGNSASATPQTYDLVWGPTVITRSGDPNDITRQAHLLDTSGRTVSSLPTITAVAWDNDHFLRATLTFQGERELYSLTVNAQMAGVYGVAAGSIVRQTVYMAGFSLHDCFEVVQFARGTREGFEFQVYCYGEAGIGNRGDELQRVNLYKAIDESLLVCVRDMNGVTCSMPISGNTRQHTIFLAFPDQTYRRDNGECESAPFYAVGNCQIENAVDVGNFAAFVSGLDGNGYRQFGVRHRFDGEGWNAAAMVSHAKGREFLDTWWGRLRFEHSVFDDASAFAEYESGITSLRQRGVMFADIPISGGRVGFRFTDFTASFGRPMHYKGKGKNAAALHWQATKQTEFSFRSHNDNAELQWQWRKEL